MKNNIYDVILPIFYVYQYMKLVLLFELYVPAKGKNTHASVLVMAPSTEKSR